MEQELTHRTATNAEAAPAQILVSTAAALLCLAVGFYATAALAQSEPILGPDVALRAGVQDRFARLRGVAAEDFDLDGDVDLVFGNTGDPSLVLWNVGIRNGIPIFDRGQVMLERDPVYVATAADYDNDGDRDVFFGVGGVDTIGFDHLFENVDGTFVEVTDLAGVAGPVGTSGNPIPTATGGAAWGDFDNDGWLDLFVSTLAVNGTLSELKGRDTLYRNRGDGTFEDVTDIAGVGGGSASWAASWIDFDNDGWLDLFVPDRDAENKLYHNNGDGTFTDVTPLVMFEPLRTWGSLPEDFNNDGWCDAFAVGRSVALSQAVDHGLFINDGAGNFSNETLTSGLNDPLDPSTYSTWMGFQAGDLTNDNLPEVFLGAGAPTGAAPNQLFLNTSADGVLSFVSIKEEIDRPAPADGLPDFPEYPYRTHGTAFVDIDDDGDLDLFIGNGGPSTNDLTKEPNRLFINETGNTRPWVKLRLEGTVSNRDAIGARVVVRTRDATGARSVFHKTVKGASGFGGNNPIDPHIGLGDSTSIDTIAVRWPNGFVSTVRAPAINSTISLIEPVAGRRLEVRDFLNRFGRLRRSR